MPRGESFRVKVTFTGLIMFLRNSGNHITHALLREGRKGHHHQGDGYPDDQDCGHLVRSDFDHEPIIAVGQSECKPLVDVKVFLRWNGAHDLPGDGPQPVGPASGLGTLPDTSNRTSFFWVPFLSEIGPKNSMRPDCLPPQKLADVVVAAVDLKGGTIYTAGHAWGRDRMMKKWIPALKFATSPQAARPQDRAAAEIVVWEVPAPEGAKEVEVVAVQLRPSKGNGGAREEVLAKFPVTQGGEVWLNVSNSPKERCWPSPGRHQDAPGPHFEMFYSLLCAPVTGETRRIPWIPGAFRPGENAVDYEDPKVTLHTCDDVGAEGTRERPLCVPAAADY